MLSEEEIYKMLLVEKLDKFPLLNELFAIRDSRGKRNDYTIFVNGYISLDVINKAVEKVNLLDNLKEIEKSHQEENGKLRVELEQEKSKTPETIRKQFEVYQNKIQALEKQHDYDMQMIDEVKGNAVKWANELEQEKEKNEELEYQNKILQEKNQDYKCNYDTMAKQKEEALEKLKQLEEHQKQYLDGELITAKQGKFFEKMIKENYISKDKIKELLENEIIDISGFRCIAVEDIENLLEGK